MKMSIKKVDFLRSEKKKPAQNKAFHDLLNRQTSRFFGNVV
jgi:hypothetical protein